MKQFIYILYTLCLSVFCNNALADVVKLPGNIAVHIAKTHYEHPVRLLHPYLDIWHLKGPMAEKVALKALEKRFANTHLCNETSNADVVLLLEPHMYYNPQLRVFHGEFIARAYTNSTATDKMPEPITTIKKQAQQNGELGIKPDFYMEKAYAKAMDKVINKLETDKAFLDTLKATSKGNAETLCPALDDLPVAKIFY